MEWDDAIEEAKEELGISGWTDNWDEDVDLAKQKYWVGDSFKELKEETISDADGECELCGFKERLTAHHIFYGKSELTICVCKKCHTSIHKVQKKFGFIMQLVLKNWEDTTRICDDYPNLASEAFRCIEELNKEIYQNQKIQGAFD